MVLFFIVSLGPIPAIIGFMGRRMVHLNQKFTFTEFFTFSLPT